MKPYLPGSQTHGAQQVSTRLNFNVFVIFSTDFTELEGGAHLAVELILLLRHFDVVLGEVLQQETEVRVDVPPIWVQVAATANSGLIYQALKNSTHPYL